MEQALSVPNELVKVQTAREQRAAFAQLYDHYFPKVYSYLLYRIQDPQVADDLTSQIFERALTRLDQYRPERGAFSTWLFAIARNCLKKHWRRERLRRLLPLEAARHRPAAAPTVEEMVDQNDQLAQLMPLIRALDERERNILALKFGAGLTNRRIAEITGLTANHVGVLVYRTLKQLREALHGEEG